MLVPKTWIDEWYKTEHPIKKSFTYLFKNPLWDKDVPRGFSVCPYFWMSVILSPLFRVFMVWPFLVVLGFLHVTRLSKLDKWLWKTDNDSDYNYKPGQATAIVLLTMLAAIVSVGLLSFGIYKSTSQYFYISNYAKAAGLNPASFLIAVWGTIIGVIICTISEYYKKVKNTECRVEVYVYLWAIIVSVMTCMYSWDSVAIWLGFFGQGFSATWAWICMATGVCVDGIWWAIKWAGGMMGLGIATLFGVVLIWIPMIIGFFCLIGLGWVCLMGEKLFGPNRTPEQIKKEKKEIEFVKFNLERKKLFILNWKNELEKHIMALFSSSIRIKLKACLGFKGYSRKKEECEITSLMNRIITNMKYALDSDAYFQFIEDVRELDMDNEEDLAKGKEKLKALIYSPGTIYAELKALIIECSDNVIEYEKQRRIEAEEWRIKDEKREAFCKIFTDFASQYISEPFAALGRYIGICFGFVWSCFAASFKFSIVFIVHLWTVIWAGKKKACPYILFPEEGEGKGGSSNAA